MSEIGISLADQLKTLIWPTVNASILVGILVKTLRKPLATFVVERSKTVGEDLRSVRAQLVEAQKKHEDFSAKLKAVAAEVASIREQAHQDAEAIRARLLGEAKRLGDSIVADAAGASRSLVGELRAEMLRGFVEQAIARAEKRVVSTLTRDDQTRLRQEFSKKMENLQ